MGSSIFADESGDESAHNRDAGSGQQSIFRESPDGRGQDETDRSDDDRESAPAAEATGDDGEHERDGDDGEHERDGDASSGPTMTVFSGGEVYEIGVDDA